LLEIVSGEGQTALVGSIIDGVAFLLTGAGGRPVSVPIQATFQVTRGEDIISSAGATTAADGTLRLPRWTLGSIGGVDEVRVSTSSFGNSLLLPPVFGYCSAAATEVHE